MPASPLRLGHIVYSNCFPVHARLIDRPAPDDPELVRGTPSHLNELLARGDIDVAPCSSIEYARHPDRYRILPGLVIGSRGAVRSIFLIGNRAPTELGGRTVALPTASATSVVLLKILLRVRWGVEARFIAFDQARDNPFARGADAALFIGDVALRPNLYPGLPVRLDLGVEWWAETGLPFAFAVWQTGSGAEGDLCRLHQRLLDSREYGTGYRAGLATRYADHFGLPAALLDEYWRSLAFDLDAEMIEGLRTFYRMAAEVGELGRVPEPRWIR